MITIVLAILFLLFAIAGFESGYIIASYIDAYLTDRKITRARIELLIQSLNAQAREKPIVHTTAGN